MTKASLSGNGPWEFEIPELAPGEVHNLDFRNMEYNGQKGYFREFLPLDDLQVTNRSDTEPVGLSINHEYGGNIEPNTSRVFDDSGIAYLTIENRGSNTLAGGECAVEVSDNGYTQDDLAREKKKNSGDNPFIRAAREIVPGFNPL